MEHTRDIERSIILIDLELEELASRVRILKSKRNMLRRVVEGATRNANQRDKPLILTTRTKIRNYLSMGEVGRHYAEIAMAIGENPNTVKSCLSKHPEFYSDDSAIGYWCLTSRYYDEGVRGNHAIG